MSVDQVSPLDDNRAYPGMPKPNAILVVDNVRRAFGGLVAVDVAHAEVEQNTITALIGPNGAGKTTFFNLLTGFDAPNTGNWTFAGTSAGGVPPHRMARRGMVRTFQLTKSLARLTVIENMRLGASGQRGESVWAAPFRFLWSAQEQSITERAEALLRRFKLDHMRDEFAGSLSGGQRKLLEMARALMADPSLIMLDEPMAGVNPALKQSLLEHIVALKEEGRTVLFVEHDMDMVHEISDWVLVMAEGRLVAEGTAAQISGDQAVIDAYLGAHHDVDLGVLDEDAAMSQLGLDASELGVETLQQIAEDHESSEWGDEAQTS